MIIKNGLVLSSLMFLASSGFAKVGLSPVLTGLDNPVGIIFSPKDAKKNIYVLEQRGVVRRAELGKAGSEVWLDITDRVTKLNPAYDERGLLGMAFHPQFPKDSRVFMSYTTGSDGKSRISQFNVGAKNEVDKASEKIILEQEQPFMNHNGGDIKFGTDGYLYISFGDGGSGGDPRGNGQNLTTMLGKMLRIDINSKDKPYAIPADNPKFPAADARPEIYAYGLRNVWRFSFDRETNELWAADVGQNSLEEIDIIKKGGNYGWNIMEGNSCFKDRGCKKDGLELPVFEYGRKDGSSITGGYVYRGAALPQLKGFYLYSDYGSGNIWELKFDGKKVTENKLIAASKRVVVGFGEDADGEIYLADYKGTILKLVP